MAVCHGSVPKFYTTYFQTNCIPKCHLNCPLIDPKEDHEIFLFIEKMLYVRKDILLQRLLTTLATKFPQKYAIIYQWDWELSVPG